MKNLMFLIFLLIFSKTCFAQENFEGIITFKTEISVPKNAPKDFLTKLNYKYGDSLQMFYIKEGNFKRKYLNSGDKGGLDYQTYNAESGKLFIKKKNTEEVQTSDVSINSLQMISFKQIENEFIMNLDCECYQYIGKAINNKEIKQEFCFSKLMNKINTKAFEKFNDFFVNDYFKIAERPYLKYTLTLDEFTLKFIAAKITKGELKKLNDKN